MQLAFLHLDEYQTITKVAGCGPDRDEFPEVGFGQVCKRRPLARQQRWGGAFHFWPEGPWRIVSAD
jgi:hypothetical protein